jgi:hypothetical protein
VCSKLISDIEVLQQREENACQETGLKPGVFERVCIFARQRPESCVHGNHAEHLLAAEVTQIPPVSH